MDSQPKLTGHVFISYAREDLNYTHKLRDSLRKRGYEVWLDEHLESGDRWLRTIEQAVRDSAAHVVVMTPESRDSEWVEREILLAQSEGKPIFPLLLHGEVFFLLINTQYDDVTDGRMPPDDFYERLEREVRASSKEEDILAAALPAPEPATERKKRAWHWPLLGLLALVIGVVVVGVVASGLIGDPEESTPKPTIPVLIAAGGPTPTHTRRPARTSSTLAAIVIDTPLSTSTPSPTVTSLPQPTETPTPVPTGTSTSLPPTVTPTSTGTPLPPTVTPTPTNTPLPPTNTPTPTDTPLPSTNGPTLTGTPSPTPTPTISPTPGPEGWLAYPEYDSTRRTFSIKIYDLAQKRIVDTIDQASQPAISPNGQQIAYHSWRPGELGVFWRDIDVPGPGERIGQLSEAYRPQWRADNQRLIFSFVQGGIKDIRYLDQDDRGLPMPGQATMPAWLSLNPEQLVFQGCIDVRCGLMTADANGANANLLTNLSDDLAPAPAPDGRQVAFMSERDDNWDIYLFDLQSRALTRLTDNPARDGLPVFSPDGNQVAYVSDRGGQWAVWLLDWRQPEPEGTPVRLVRIPGGLEGPIADVSEELQPGWWYESISWWRE